MPFLRHILLVFAAALVACHAPSAPAPAASGSEPVKIPQWSGQQGGAGSFGVRTLRTPDAWSAFWRDTGREPPRPLDPAREMAVILSLGERPTGGYRAEIISAGAEGGEFVIAYREHAPPPDAFVTQALTTPWVAAIVPRSDLPVVPRKADPK